MIRMIQDHKAEDAEVIRKAQLLFWSFEIDPQEAISLLLSLRELAERRMTEIEESAGYNKPAGGV